jgi:hypothetical protein
VAGLDEVIGALLASVARARRIADEESAVIAEYYRSNPLLEGMSVPRVRLPDLTFELPVLIEAHEPGQPGKPQSPTEIAKKVKQHLDALSGREGVRLPRGFATSFQRELKDSLSEVAVEGAAARAAYAKAVETAFLRVAGHERFAGELPARFRRDAALAVRDFADQIALKEPGSLPRFQVSVITSQIKDKTDPANVARLRIAVREEGLEWSISEREDGTISKKLIPE